jgi:ketosteroid isomerase-like protein
MLKNSFVAALLAALVISLSACGGGDSTPDAAMKKVADAWQSMDPAKLEACYDADTWKAKGESMKKEMKEMKEAGMSVTITWSEADITVSGDTATVKAKMKIKDKDGKEEDETETVDFKKTADGWKCTD